MAFSMPHKLMVRLNQIIRVQRIKNKPLQDNAVTSFPTTFFMQENAYFI